MRKLFLGAVISLCSILCTTAAYAAIDVTGWEDSFCTIPSGKEAGVEFVQDGEDKAPDGGLGMLYLWCGGPTGTANLNANAVCKVKGLDTEKKYRFTADIKYSNNDTLLLFQNATIDGTEQSKIDLRGTFGVENNGVWIKAKYDIVPTNATVQITFQALANRNMRIDNVSLKEILYEEDGTTEAGLGDELIVNGDFEADLDFEAPDEVTNITVENMDSAAKIKWTNPTEDFAAAYVYPEGETTAVASTEDGYVVIDGLENDREYTYIIKTADKMKNFSDGVSVTVKPVADKFKASAVKFEVNGAETDKLSEGTLKASVTLKNNGCAEDFCAELIVVLLKDGALVDITTGYSVIPLSGWKEAGTTLTAELTVPAGEGYSARAYVWSSLGEMKTVADGRISK